jgi:hypothetical protein
MHAPPPRSTGRARARVEWIEPRAETCFIFVV